MAETEAKALEEEHETVVDDLNKENVVPDASKEDDDKAAPSKEPAAIEEEKETVESAAKSLSKADAVSSDLDLSIYTEDKLYDDIKELALDPTTSSKKKFRAALAAKYGIGGKGKIFKKYTPFDAAIDRIVAECNPTVQEQDGVQDAESEKKEKSKRKSRKRKRTVPEEEEAENSGLSDPPKKKRKTNDGGSVVDEPAADGNDHGESEGDDEEGSDRKEDKAQSAKSKKKKKSKEPHFYTLTQLKKLSRAVGLANPKMYGKLKEMKSNKKRVEFLKELLKENNVSTVTLSEAAIRKLKEEHALKREMAELGIVTATDQELEAEDGVPLSTRRQRRKRDKVNYRMPAMPKLEDEDEDEEEQQDGEEYEEEQESEESDAYQPSDMDEDDDY